MTITISRGSAGPNIATWRLFLLMLCLALTSCSRHSLEDSEKADHSVTALLSRRPSKKALPASVRIQTDNATAVFSGKTEIAMLAEVLSSSLLSGADPQMRQQQVRRANFGTLTVTVDGADTSYVLERGNDPNLWAILLPDRSHPSVSICFLRDDGRLTKLLRSYRIPK